MEHDLGGTTEASLRFWLKWFIVAGGIGSWLIDAPFGKHGFSSRLNVPGRLGFCLMELVSPICFLHRFIGNRQKETSYQGYVLAALFVTHYMYRAIVSPLFRAPRISPMHISVPLSAMVFNYLNGSCLGLFLSSHTHNAPLPVFLVCILGWVLGFGGNVWHEEILYRLRRKTAHKVRASTAAYGFPEGGLFTFVSFPHYFCEWIEWLSFAVACSPVPGLSSPWLFFYAEIATMTPRALSGHEFYKRRHPEKIGRRRAVFPFLM